MRLTCRSLVPPPNSTATCRRPVSGSSCHRGLNTLSPARLLYDGAQDGPMRQSHTGGLLEEEGVLLHPGDRVKIGKPQLTVLQHPAIKTRKIVHAKERKELLRLHLDALDNLVGKSRWTVERYLAGREVFATIVKNLMGLVVLLDLCRYYRHWQPKTIFQHNHREFCTTGTLLQHHARVHTPAKEQFDFLNSLGWGSCGED